MIWEFNVHTINPDTNQQMGVFKNALAIVVFDGMREKGVLFNE